MIKIQEKTPNYGGAYDIEPDQYFTRDDLTDLADEVCNHIEETYYLDSRPEIEELYIERDNDICMTISIDGMSVSVSCHIDMRKIHKPSDLKNKYWGCFVSKIREEMDQFYNSDTEVE